MTRARARALTRYTERLLGSPSLPPPPLDTPPLYKLQRVTLLQPPNFAVDPKTSFTLELVHRQARPPPEASSRASSRDSVGDAAPADAAPDAAVTSPAWRSWKVYDHLKMGGSSHTSNPGGGAYVLECPSGQRPILAGDVKLVLTTPKGG